MSPEEIELWKAAIAALTQTPAGWGIILTVGLWVLYRLVDRLWAVPADRINERLVDVLEEQISRDLQRIAKEQETITNGLAALSRRIERLTGILQGE